jgi:tRNA 2-thiocytidine biosynthesis protein TtcA
VFEFSSRLEKKLFIYTKKAIDQFQMIAPQDRVMVCLSGGKDSFTMLAMLDLLRQQYRHPFSIFAFTLDQAQPGWDDSALRTWLHEKKITHEILRRDTYSIVKTKVKPGATYCSLCSRLRRGNIYAYAEKNGYNKIALGHHRDDLITTLLMSIFYNGRIQSMPPKLRSDNGQHVVIRPLSFCQEKDIANYARAQQFPLIPCTLCGSQENLARKRVQQLINELTQENAKIPSNMLHALANVQLSQLMDQRWWDFEHFVMRSAGENDEVEECSEID